MTAADWTDCRVDGYSSPRACELAGITFRQLDYWCRTGLFQPCQDAHGSGTRRRFSRRDVVLLAALGHEELTQPLRRTLAAALRDVDPLPPWVVIVGDWSVAVCTTETELHAAILAERSAVIRVVYLDGLVDFGDDE